MKEAPLFERGEVLGKALFDFIVAFNDFAVQVDQLRQSQDNCHNRVLLYGALHNSVQMVNNQLLALTTVFALCSPLSDFVPMPEEGEAFMQTMNKTSNEQN
ncbi:MAG TPA: hypothetical protein V6C65_40095, partial [Allocoleopsis sp.]